ncbi:MAG TPA: transglycosylase SLT domain-containing protein [Bryobacterales bacterium]|nr:transglycosylase SLT domain-containing protein [Bryobacterales bacterium]
MRDNANPNAWLVRVSEPLAGARSLLRGPVTRVGRSPDNDVVIDDGRVSAYHLEIQKLPSGYRLCDLGSTNGTYLNGERVNEAALEHLCCIRLGADGPELRFTLGALPAADLNRTVLSSEMPAILAAAAAAPDRESGESLVGKEEEELLSMAVARARRARRTGIGGQTTIIMREVLHRALDRTSRRFRRVIAALILALLAVAAYGAWRIQTLKREKRDIDGQIQEIETLLEKAGQDPAETERLLEQLRQYEDQAQALESNLFYRAGVREHEDPVLREIRSLMAEFGAETYSIPPEFLDEVNHFIQQYQGPNRLNMTLALGQARPNMDAMRQIFEQSNLPPDLAYMVLVESALSATSTSPAGAVGLWQFTPATARQYGLRVSGNVDERLNAKKATQAACKYVRELILDFGAGSSVMLALAAYNLGPSKVKQAVRRVSDPIKQRNFWYLYRVRALPEETREYVPKVIAAMIIARHPEQFGF